MITLDEYIGRVFYKSNSNGSLDVSGGISHLNLVWKINNMADTFTIPRLMLENLNKLNFIQNMQDSEIVMPLRFVLPTLSYPEVIREFKSVTTFFRNVLELMYNKKLTKCIVDNETYYVGNDLILDVNLVPILTFGYEIKYNSDGEKYIVASKILYVSPSVYDNINKMSRFLSNKFIPAFLSQDSVDYPIRVPGSSFWASNNRKASNVKIIIDKFHTPFKLVKCNNSENLSFNTDAIKSDLQYLFQ